MSDVHEVSGPLPSEVENELTSNPFVDAPPLQSSHFGSEAHGAVHLGSTVASVASNAEKLRGRRVE